MDELLRERFELSKKRICEIAGADRVKGAFEEYFKKTASFIIKIYQVLELVCQDDYQKLSQSELDGWNQSLYEDILPEHYAGSYGNPDYAKQQLGEEFGAMMSFLYTEIRGMIVYAHEQRSWDITTLSELFIQIYNQFEEQELPSAQTIGGIISADIGDYCDEIMAYRVREIVDPSLSFATDIIMQADLCDLRYLYLFGEYITENELMTARFLNTLPEAEIEAMARTYTQGYQIGFANNGIDLSKKSTVNIRYCLGFERMIRAAVRQFAKIGLKPIIYRCATHTINKKQHARIGYFGHIPNQQYDYDHRGDAAFYLSDSFVSHRLRALQQGFENYRELAKGHAGPAVVEIFGEKPFVPENKASSYKLSEFQQQLQVHYDNEAGQITNRYIIGAERSFTIIAYPIPEIGDEFEAIFREMVRVNTLDYNLYQDIQQHIIDALDQGIFVHIKGANQNQTDLRVALCRLKNPQRETIFENCVADVNIPVGEVFTTPVLKGTNGILHVSRVYLNELHYQNLKITFADGMVSAYDCSNFAKAEDNRAYIRENILHHHKTLPLGEFAVGTNTTAYMMAAKYQIADRLPILIAEKMGPHFAVGDTCYNWSEDTPVYNRDGKEIIARDNEISIYRKSDISKAYFGCHTDITIPYEELDYIRVHTADGKAVSIIEQGRFVLPGTEVLNEPFTG